jgi:hypothetical protein
MIRPKYLTKEIAEKAVDMAVEVVMGQCPVKRKDCRVTVLVPTMITEGYKFPNYPIVPEVLLRKDYGDKPNWEYEFDEISECKTLQLWQGRNAPGNESTPVHLLFTGDTPFWGGDVTEGIVTSCSGVQPWYDKAISRISNALMIAAAREVWENSDDKKNGVSFLA